MAGIEWWSGVVYLSGEMSWVALDRLWTSDSLPRLNRTHHTIVDAFNFMAVRK